MVLQNVLPGYFLPDTSDNKYINIGQKEIFDFEEENEPIPTEIPKEEIRLEENATSSTQNNPPLEHVKIYFNEKGISETEAEKFFNHYEALGWVTSSGTQIQNWKASARNWIINIPKFNQKQVHHPRGKTQNLSPKTIKTSH